MKQKKQILWAGVSAFLFAFFIITALSPLAIAQDNNHEIDKYINMFEQVFRFVKDNYVEEPDSKVLYEGALKGLFASLEDPYSYYLTEKDMGDLSDTTVGEFGGVGLYIAKDPPAMKGNTLYSPWVKVVAPIEGTPGYSSKINAGDFITEIEGESTAELTSEDAVEKLRGRPGTKVEVTILRGKNIIFNETLKRAIIEIPTVKYDMIDDIAYIRIIQFTPFTAERVEEAIASFNDKKYSSLIIDLRNNPGGLLSSVVKISDYFLSDDVIVSTKSRSPYENAVYKAKHKTLVDKKVPIVVLINKGSASASEILAGALKDRKRGTIIGETSYGKGSVQQVRPYGSGGLKLTMARYYTPSEINIDKIGIDPDIEVKEIEFTEEETESYKKLVEEGLISTFLEAKKNPTDKDINNFFNKLKKENIILPERIIKKLIKNELNRTNNSPPVYDMEFDLILQEAVKTITKN